MEDINIFCKVPTDSVKAQKFDAVFHLYPQCMEDLYIYTSILFVPTVTMITFLHISVHFRNDLFFTIIISQYF